MLQINKSLIEEILYYLQRDHELEVLVEDDVYIIGNKAFCVYDLTSPWVPENKRARSFTNDRLINFKDRGISLFQLVDVNGFTLRNFILAKLCLLPKIQARKTTVSFISEDVYKSLLNSYHIQGATPSSYRYGLYEDGVLVAAMGFIKSNEGFNLNRLVFGKKAVVGGAGKLLAHFRKTHSGPIVTFSNNGYSDGGIYKTLGFNCTNEEDSDMWYVDQQGHLLNRRGFQKKTLKSKLSIFDPDLTEVKNMIANGFKVYYGPGTKRWELV